MTTEYVELRQQVREATQTVDWVREQLLVAKLPGQNALLDWEADLTTVSQVLQMCSEALRPTRRGRRVTPTPQDEETSKTCHQDAPGSPSGPS